MINYSIFLICISHRLPILYLECNRNATVSTICNIKCIFKNFVL